MDMQAQTELMQHATGFVNSAVADLTEKLGRAPNDQELLIFSSAVSSMMASYCYSKVHETVGREAADSWMQQIFVQMGVGVQARGTPVTLQITLKSLPMDSAPEGQSPIAQDKPPIVICKCVTDAKGDCPSCLKELTEGFGSIVDICSTLEKFQYKERCKPCVQKFFDAAFAEVVKEKYPSVSGMIRDMITTMSVQMGSSNGVTQIPKTEAALASFMQKEG